MPIVVVLVPTHNRAAMLRQCLESVRSQTLRDFSVTIGDDCSEDGTPDVAREFCMMDERFRYVRNARNLGQFGNVNALISGVTAPYIHILHDDDWIEPDFYARLVPVLESSVSAGVVFSRSQVSQPGREYPPLLPVSVPRETLLPHEDAFQWILDWQTVPPDAALIRAAALREVGPFEEGFQSSDWLMWLKLTVGHDVAIVDAPLAHYRIHSEQVSTDRLRLYKDVMKMLTFASLMPEFEGHSVELIDTRFATFRSYVLALKESPDACRDVLDFASFFRQLDSDHELETTRVVRTALLYAAMPHWFRHGVMAKGTGFRRVVKRLLGFGDSRGEHA